MELWAGRMGRKLPALRHEDKIKFEPGIKLNHNVDMQSCETIRCLVYRNEIS